MVFREVLAVYFNTGTKTINKMLVKKRAVFCCTYTWEHFFSMAQQPLVGQSLLIIEASRSHSDTPHSVELLWTRDQPVAETSTWKHTILTRDRHPCPRRDYLLSVRDFSLWSIFVLFKSFRPSCHFTFHATVLTTNTTQTSMPPVGFEPTLLVSERPQTHVLDRAATGIGRSNPGLCRERQATNRLSHDTVKLCT
jgi:hypothetical protein